MLRYAPYIFGGKTALHIAALNGHKAAVIALIDAGADKNSKDLDGRTPADWAQICGYADLAAFIDSYVSGHTPAPRRPHLCTIQ